ncbi:GSCFA domain-containing protein [Hymenobacter sp. DG01]|uniref:GSCFA domain-containing protein n=1 Tax=Hymenobacter sp. DG01 TaxID=2584940 RepID=UPI0011230E7A|nr:GSCFA domain-containing protein [Hymenobacter sp. DG01]
MFRTELPLTPHPQQLPLSARVLTLGSCFSDSIGSRLRDFKVATMVNPFGTVFNPISACKLLRAAAGEDTDWQQHLVEARGRWQSHDLHAEVGADNPVELLQHIQTLTRETGVFLATADAVVLTLGSAYAYRLRETDEIISNCHKLPAEKFNKELLTADEIIAAVAETHAYLRRINPRLRFILTVSPVRHVKDTLVLNSVSKSMLRVACHYLSDLLPDVTYFPAYELLLDDLRDYRFYSSDMLHPSEVAENYIWERFTRTYFDAAFGRFKKEWETIRQALGHRPLYAAAPEHRQFLEGTLERLRRLSGQADVRMETLHVERELAALPLPPAPAEPEPEEDFDDEERIDIGDLGEEEAGAAAALVGRGAGVLIESEEEVVEEPEEEEITPDSAYEHAYLAGATDEEEEASLPTDAVAGSELFEGEEPVKKKKRRSRGGAKRTKRKHARLAAEAEAAQVTAATLAPLEEPQETISLEPTSEVLYITEAELRRGQLPASEPETVETEEAPAATPADSAEPTETAPEKLARRSRNRRREPREDAPARSGGRNGRRPLYAAEDLESDDSISEKARPEANQILATPLVPEPTVAEPAITAQPQPEAAAPAPEPPAPTGPADADVPDAAALEAALPAATRATRSRKPAPAQAARPPRSRKAAPTAETTSQVAEPEAAPVTPAPTLPTDISAATDAAAPVQKPAPKPRNKRQAAAPKAAPEVSPAEAPATTASEPPTAVRKRAPRRPATKPTAPEPTPAATPEASPVAPEPAKPRARAPRRKPAPDASSPETT